MLVIVLLHTQNFLVYLQLQTKKSYTVFEELHNCKLKKKGVYSAKVTRFALLDRYTPIQSYRTFAGRSPFAIAKD